MSAWLDSFVEFFRSLGFYRGLEATDSDELASILARRFTDDWNVPPSPDVKFVEQLLASYDDARTLYETLHADAGPGNTIYLELLKMLSRLQAAPAIRDIGERWVAGRCLVTLTVNGEVRELSGRFLDGWIDEEILSGIVHATARSENPLRITKMEDFALFFFASDDAWEKIRSRPAWSHLQVVA